MNHRPLAVQLIAFYLWLKAIVLTGCVIAACLHPFARSTANGVIEGFVPMIMAWHEPALDIWLASLFVLIDATLGTGIWFLQNWARIIVVIDLAWLYSRALLGLPIAVVLYYRHHVHAQNPSVYFDINIVAGLLILAALCDPDVKHAFGVRY